ncbi:hypothetical protein GYMLUDRAFT_234133 [Collybiopsis luxurians FD-317 M1]|uniref:NAD(P)-binding protein n=1 Tax=Collybiopsis luxurians FD-317 M1 TaxID=944289 RepID=A0A0D0AMF9_9AGAR|nr:hypothetical protein GYMLUDRAFT_234133 [Collybiopsis luxurians FD-317 M1]
MTTTTVYFVTGANRGIGLALVAELAANVQNAFVYAGVRDPTQSTNLQKLVSNYPGKIAPVQYVAGDVAGNRAIAETIKSKHGVVDVVIGSAGISSYMGLASETPAEALREHFEVNVIGMVILFQAMLDILRASAHPKFIPITSGSGSLTAYIDLPMGYTCYGSSKAALNYVSRKIHFENDWLTCVPIAPGVVDTDMAAANSEMDKTGTISSVRNQLMISPEECATALIKLIQGATREKDGGEFINFDGTKISW